MTASMCHVLRTRIPSLKSYFCVYISPSLAQDTVFSCVVTALFLRPIFKILGEVGGVRSPGQISLEKTKWLTLVGACLAVLSSTALYINFGLLVVLGKPGKPFYANPYLNVLVFGINLDSVLNDVGMLLACGVLQKVTYKAVAEPFSTASLWKAFSRKRLGKTTAIVPQDGATSAHLHAPSSAFAVGSLAQESSTFDGDSRRLSLCDNPAVLKV